MFIQPLGDTLRGFHWEPSAFSKTDFYVNVFFLPLYLPTKHLHFTFGHRVGRNKRWTADSAELANALSSEMLKELPFLSMLRTAKDVAKALEPLTKPNEAGYVNPHSCEALAYTLVRAGETTEAVDLIERLLKKANLAVDWEREIASRAQLIKDNLLEKPEKAKELLAEWKSETIRNLRLQTVSSDHRG
jgi:hypothetical protein